MPKRNKGKGRVGRPRKAGARFPSGQLKRTHKQEANARVLAERRRLLGSDDLDPSLADDALTLAHARGWLTTRRLRASQAIADLARRAGFASPRLQRGSSPEAQMSAVDAAPVSKDWMTGAFWLGVSRAEIADAFVAVFDERKLRTAEEREADEAKAAARFKDVRDALTGLECKEVDQVCIGGDWPSWLFEMIDAPEGEAAKGLSLGAKHQRRRLEHALDKAAAVIFKPKSKADEPGQARTAADALVAGGPLREESTLYVDEDGAPVLEVVRRTRRPAEARG